MIQAGCFVGSQNGMTCSCRKGVCTHHIWAPYSNTHTTLGFTSLILSSPCLNKASKTFYDGGQNFTYSFPTSAGMRKQFINLQTRAAPTQWFGHLFAFEVHISSYCPPQPTFTSSRNFMPSSHFPPHLIFSHHSWGIQQITF